jgi:glycosyltransferase involved in cell wall biosynthesis
MLLPYLPYPPDSGGKTRSFNLLKSLSASHDIYLGAFIRDESEKRHVEGLRSFCQEVHVFPRNRPWSARLLFRHLFSDRSFYEEVYWLNEAGAYFRKLFEDRGIDLAHLECSYVGKYQRFFPKGRRLMLEHNIEYRVFERYCAAEKRLWRRLLLWLEARRIRQSEQQVWREADVCGAVSEVDRAEILRVAPHKPVWVIPNGAAAPEPTRPVVEAAAGKLLLTGNFKFFANIDAANFLCQDILPRIRQQVPDVELMLVGSGANEGLKQVAGTPGVKIVDWVPELDPYFSTAAVYVCPLRIGSGTKLKLLEALVRGKAIVATRVAAEGIDVEDGTHLLLADSADEFARQVCRLLADRGLGDHLGRAAAELAQRKYSWKLIAEELVRAYRSMLEAAGAGRAADSAEQKAEVAAN